MGTYLIINGKNVHVIEKDSMEDAREYATNYMNHSYEVIVREIDNFSYPKKKSERLTKLLSEWKEYSTEYAVLQPKISSLVSSLTTLNVAIYEECKELGIDINELNLSYDRAGRIKHQN